LLKIFPDESLHSYILRIVISHGLANSPDDITGIISRAGVMRTDIVLTEQQRRVFSAFSIMTLIELVRNHMPVTGNPKHLNPKSLAAKCSRIFFHERIDVSEKYIFDYRKRTKRIDNLHYCPVCIREQIQEHGSGWFKLSWLVKNHCDVHNLSLVPIKQQACSCKLNIFDKVISALSGKCVCCKSETKLPPISMNPTTRFIISTYGRINSFPFITQNHYGDHRDVPFSACFVRNFEKWAKELFRKLIYDEYRPESFIGGEIHHVLRKLFRANKPIAPDDLLHAINLFERHSYDLFCDFMDQQVEILAIDCSDCAPVQIFVDFKVARDRDCATCEVKNGVCPFKTT
jgi:hypothetical protein